MSGGERWVVLGLVAVVRATGARADDGPDSYRPPAAGGEAGP